MLNLNFPDMDLDLDDITVGYLGIVLLVGGVFTLAMLVTRLSYGRRQEDAALRIVVSQHAVPLDAPAAPHEDHENEAQHE